MKIWLKCRDQYLSDNHETNAINKILNSMALYYRFYENMCNRFYENLLETVNDLLKVLSDIRSTWVSRMRFLETIFLSKGNKTAVFCVCGLYLDESQTKSISTKALVQ